MTSGPVASGPHKLGRFELSHLRILSAGLELGKLVDIFDEAVATERNATAKPHPRAFRKLSQRAFGLCHLALFTTKLELLSQPRGSHVFCRRGTEHHAVKWSKAWGWRPTGRGAFGQGRRVARWECARRRSERTVERRWLRWAVARKIEPPWLRIVHRLKGLYGPHDHAAVLVEVSFVRLEGWPFGPAPGVFDTAMQIVLEPPDRLIRGATVQHRVH